METLSRKLDAMTLRYNECKKELKQLKKDVQYKNTSTCNSCNKFRKAVGSTSTDHKNKKRRMERAKTPNDFWNLNF
jgi:hypothetical protein